MSGLVQWTSKAKSKPKAKKAGSKANPHRQRSLAMRKRKANESATKAACVAKRRAQKAQA